MRMSSWQDFVTRAWTAQPALLARMAEPLLTPEECFAGLVAASDQIRGNGAAIVRLYQDHGLLHANILAHLPVPTDGSLASYIERLKRQSAHRDCVLIANEFQVHQPHLWQRLVQWLEPLHRRVGIPEDTLVSLFAGDYQNSPFGVHFDLDHTFYFQLGGRKRLHVWPHEAAQELGTDWPRPLAGGSTRYREHLACATTLELAPGDVAYIPARHWHVFEAEPGLSLSLSVGVPQPCDTLVAAASQRLFGPLAVTTVEQWHPVDLDDLEAAGAALPARLAEQVSRAHQALVHLRRAAHLEWLDRLTSRGFRKLPRPQPWNDLAAGDWLARTPEYELLVIEDPEDRDTLLCSCAGHHFTVPATESTRHVLALVGSGRAFCVGQVEAFASTHAGSASPRSLRTLLEKLLTLGGITRVAPGGAAPARAFSQAHRRAHQEQEQDHARTPQ